MPSAGPIIFLSYAAEDRRRISAIYRHLRAAGLNPWMDRPPRPWQLEGIGPGDDWEMQIRRRMDEAALILLFLSRRSLAKKGYVQRECRLALHLAAGRPPSQVSVIPILLERCDVPDIRVDTVTLRGFQWHQQYQSSAAELVTLVERAVTPLQRMAGMEGQSSSRSPRPSSWGFLDVAKHVKLPEPVAGASANAADLISSIASRLF